MSQTWSDGYKKIKQKFDYSYKGYNLKMLVPGYLSLDFSATPSMRDLFKIFYLSNKTVDLRRIFEISKPTLITYLIDRSDYKDLANSAQKEYPESEILPLNELPTISVSPFHPSFICHFWLAFWLVFSRSIGSNFRYKLHFVALTLKLLTQIELIEKGKKTNAITRYVCFNSAFKEESLITSYFNKKGVETISLQHGIFCDFKLFVPFDYINQDNLIAQKMLCWGQSTVDYLTKQGFDPTRFILIGNLKYKELRIGKVFQEFSSCLVLLGRESYVETNNKLLSALSEYNKKRAEKIRFYIKKHPFLSDVEHKEYASVGNQLIFVGREHSVQEILKSNLTNFSIAVNTTAYYESLVFGKPCLRWTESENEDFEGMDDKFSNLAELETQLTQLKIMDAQEIKKELENVIRYIFNPNL